MRVFLSSAGKKFSSIGIICGLAFLAIVFLPNIALAAGEPGGIQDSMRLFKDQDIWFMLMLVAFLMLFIRKFEWSVCLAVLLTAVSSAITYLLIAQLRGMPQEELWSQDMMISAVVCAITVVIAIGVFLGTIKMWQYLLVGVLFTFVFVFLEFILFTWLPVVTGGFVTDPGGGILVHQFAAYFGLGIALGIHEKRAFEEPMLTSKQSLAFVWLATMLLFVLWPSFVTALLPLEANTMVMINCYMSGFGSIIAAYLTCMAVSKNKKKKVNPLIYTYAMLAGPVASSSTLLLATPWISLLIGVVAGVLSTLSFAYLNGWLCGKLKVLDVMGVHNLHGIGGWISLLTGAMMAGSVVNIWAGLLTMALGLVGGGVIGLILRATRGRIEDQELFNDQAVFEDYNPDPRVELPEEQ